jgi:hypothetical protein
MQHKIDNDDTKFIASERFVPCKVCKTEIDLSKAKRLPKKLIFERYGLCWCGLERVFLLIYKLVCPSVKCSKKFTHKVFKSEYIYK